jgi:hypothetical protein
VGLGFLSEAEEEEEEEEEEAEEAEEERNGRSIRVSGDRKTRSSADGCIPVGFLASEKLGAPRMNAFQ